jgi:hypothetical protein
MWFMDKVVLNKEGQFKIQQMAFMLIFVFIFFSLVGLFFFQISMGNLRSSAQELHIEQTISILNSVTELPELSCSDSSSGCVDEDKLYVLSSEDYSRLYGFFWPVAYIRVYKVDSDFLTLGEIRCPGLNCNYYDVYSSNQQAVQTFATYVSICKKTRKEGYVFNECEMGKLEVGTVILEFN